MFSRRNSNSRVVDGGGSSSSFSVTYVYTSYIYIHTHPRSYFASFFGGFFTDILI